MIYRGIGDGDNREYKQKENDEKYYRWIQTRQGTKSQINWVRHVIREEEVRIPIRVVISQSFGRRPVTRRQ